MYQIERMGKSGELDRLMHTRKKPSADTLGRWAAGADCGEFRSYNGDMIQRARRNKVHVCGSICGWRVTAIDGTETFCTQSPTAEALKWSKRTLSNGATEYYERAAALSYVGAYPRPILDEVVWQIMHCRWDIENSIFNDLKRNWHFGHCYTHDINGVQTVYALFCIAFNLVMLFAYGNLKDAPARGVTLNELATQMLVGMQTLCQPITDLLPRAGPG